MAARELSRRDEPDADGRANHQAPHLTSLRKKAGRGGRDRAGLPVNSELALPRFPPAKTVSGDCRIADRPAHFRERLEDARPPLPDGSEATGVSKAEVEAALVPVSF
jgi:hypothetical protein